MDVGYVDAMRRYFMAHARRRGYETIDLEPAFVAHYRAHRERFDWRQDAHWNALGHEMCFEAVAGSALLSGGFPGSKASGRGTGGIGHGGVCSGGAAAVSDHRAGPDDGV